MKDEVPGWEAGLETTEAADGESVAATVRDPVGKSAELGSTRSWFWGPMGWVLGAVLMQHPAGALVVAGWLQRYLQRAVYRRWWKRCRGRLGRFDDFVAEEPVLRDFRRLPNWVMAQNHGEPWRLSPAVGRIRWRVGGWLESLGRNLGAGIQVVGNVGVLLMPSGVLWAAGWWGGWQNSFHKGYEQFWVGPLLFWFGIGLFLAAMMYVPMAVARQAATGRWYSFWEGRIVWTLVKSSWLPTAWVAGIFAAANVAVMGLKSFPQFLPEVRISELAKQGLDPTEAFHRGIEKFDWSNLSGPEALGILNVYYFGASLVVFVVLILLKRLLGWLYSGAVLRAVRLGTLGEEQLSDVEWRLLRALGALEVQEPRGRPWVVRVVAWAGSKLGRSLCGAVTVLGWFAFVISIVVSEFLTYHPVVGWMNQPLLHLPWFRYVPASLENPLPSLLLTVLIVGITLMVWVWRAKRPGRLGSDG